MDWRRRGGGGEVLRASEVGLRDRGKRPGSCVGL